MPSTELVFIWLSMVNLVRNLNVFYSQSTLQELPAESEDTKKSRRQPYTFVHTLQVPLTIMYVVYTQRRGYLTKDFFLYLGLFKK